MVGSVREASADPGDTCVSSYEEAQRARKAEELVRSKANLRLCLSACPQALANDCKGWLDDVDHKVAHLRVDVDGKGGAQVTAPVLEVDGATRSLAGPVELDPGKHRVVVKASGFVSHVETVELAPGSTVARNVTLERGESVTGSESPNLLAPMLLGGGGLLALAAGGVLSIVGHLDVSDMRSSCAPDCAQHRVDSVQTLWIAGGVLAGVGGAALIGSGVWLGVTLAPPGSAKESGATVTWRF